MLDKFLSYIRTEYSIDLDSHVLLLAVSGGVDSMVMLDLCVKEGFEVSVAHVDHHTRSGDSSKDADFVQDYCKQRNIPFHRFDYYHKKGNFQREASAFRYVQMQKLMNVKGIPYLLTAHHLNDNLESFIMGLGRGTGLNGIKGVLPYDPPILRPLIFTKKENIIRYAHDNQLEWVEDKSNQSSNYYRNKVRNDILPNLSSKHESFLEGLNLSHRLLMKERDLLMELLQRVIKGKPYKLSEAVVFKKTDFNALVNATTAAFLSFSKHGFSVDQCSKLNSAASGSIFYSKSHELLTSGTELLLRTRTLEKSKIEVLVTEDLTIRYLDVDISIKNVKATTKKSLRLRKKKPGDVLKLPNGMHKTVKKYLIDNKLSIWEKEEVLLLCSSDLVIDLIYPPFIATSNSDLFGIQIEVQTI